MNLGIKNKTVLVTAASKGIGKAIAESFIQEGCDVAICSSSKKNLVDAANDIKQRFGADVFWIVCDINKLNDIKKTISAVQKEFGNIDILINNCGGPPAGFFRELDEKKWQEAFEQVLLSVVRFTNLVIPDMIKNKWGRIINITSISVIEPIDNLILSNSLRTGVTAFAKTISTEIAKNNITVNNVAPGYTLTNRIYDLAVQRGKKENKSHKKVLVDMTKNVPMGRLGKPSEIASVVTFLASEKASYLTGNTIHVDGGLVKGLF